MLKWTPEQIAAMATDPSAAAAGKALATVRNWVTLGGDSRALWGECKGSGAKPYQVQIDFSEPAFKCSCPSRRFPCKHALALFLLWAQQDHSMPDTRPPAWVEDWLAKRAEKAQSKADVADAPHADTQARAQAAQEKRSADREGRVAAGIEELDRWLKDLVRGGLAAAQSRPWSYWQDMAARMVDAQAPGIARQLREMGAIPASGDAWPGRLIEKVSRVWLLIEAYRRLAVLPDALQATIRTHVGWTTKQDDVLHQSGHRAEWLVVGRRVSEQDKLLVQRTWLLSKEGSALLLHFAMKGQPFEVSFMPGTVLDADLVYFPAAFRQRAALKSLFGESPTLKAIPCYRSAEPYLARYAADLARDPWIVSHLMAITGVTPVVGEPRMLLQDADGRCLPLSADYQKSWQLAALAGGEPITLFGEWDGHSVSPLCVAADGRFVDLASGRGSRK